MNWFKENPVPAGILGFGVVLSLVGAWFVFEAASREAAELERLSSITLRVQDLERRQPPPTSEGLEKIRTAVSEYEAELNKLASFLATKEEPLEQISPQEFQDKIRQAANAIKSEAEKKNITLPEPFLMGFEEFQALLPPPDKTSALHREFKVLDRIVNALLDLEVQSIDAIQRGRITEESGEDSEPVADPAPQPTGAQDGAVSLLSVHPIRISFGAKQDVFLRALQLIPSESQFLVIRSLALENSAPEPPPRKEAAEPSEEENAVEVPLPDESSQTKLREVFGQEIVKATLDMELLDFAESSAQTVSKPAASPAAAQPAN